MTKIKDFVAFKKSGGLTELSQAIKKALAPVEAKYGIVITPGKMNYTEGYVDVKLTASVVNSSGEIETRDSAEFRISATLYGLKESDLYREFFDRGHTFKIVGANGGRKLPILVLDVNSNQRYQMSAIAVIEALTLKAKVPA